MLAQTTNATYAFNISRAQEVVDWWEAWFKASPRTLESGTFMKRDPSLGPFIEIWVVLVNASSPETDAAFAKLSAFAFNRYVWSLEIRADCMLESHTSQKGALC